MDTTTYGNVNFSGTAKSLLQRLNARDLSLEEFLRECAFWAIKDGFDELRVRPYPSKPQSEAFKDYYMLPPGRRAKVDTVTFLRNPEILSWFDQCRKIRNMNISCFNWLKELRNYIPADDLVCLEKISAKIQEFQDFVDRENELIKNIKDTFGAEETVYS